MPRPIVTAFVYDRKGRLLASAQNSYIKTHPMMLHYGKKVGQTKKVFLHAEVAALVRCDWEKAHRIVVTRYNSKGEPVCAKPCPICSQVIKDAGIKIVEHT